MTFEKGSKKGSLKSFSPVFSSSLILIILLIWFNSLSWDLNCFGSSNIGCSLSWFTATPSWVHECLSTACRQSKIANLIFACFPQYQQISQRLRLVHFGIACGAHWPRRIGHGARLRDETPSRSSSGEGTYPDFGITSNSNASCGGLE